MSYKPISVLSLFYFTSFPFSSRISLGFGWVGDTGVVVGFWAELVVVLECKSVWEGCTRDGLALRGKMLQIKKKKNKQKRENTNKNKTNELTKQREICCIRWRQFLLIKQTRNKTGTPLTKADFDCYNLRQFVVIVVGVGRYPKIRRFLMRGSTICFLRLILFGRSHTRENEM